MQHALEALQYEKHLVTAFFTLDALCFGCSGPPLRSSLTPLHAPALSALARGLPVLSLLGLFYQNGCGPILIK